jgi:hypothetical protein
MSSSNNVYLKSRIESLSARMIAIGMKGQPLLDIIEWVTVSFYLTLALVENSRIDPN